MSCHEEASRWSFEDFRNLGHASDQEGAEGRGPKKHGGNVSALIEELVEGLKRQEAFERLWKWYGGPELTDKSRRSLDAEILGKRTTRRRNKAA